MSKIETVFNHIGAFLLVALFALAITALVWALYIISRASAVWYFLLVGIPVYCMAHKLALLLIKGIKENE